MARGLADRPDGRGDRDGRGAEVDRLAVRGRDGRRAGLRPRGRPPAGDDRRALAPRAGVILPRDFDREPGRRYPLRVRIGGFGDRYTTARAMMAPGSAFRRAWLADDAPRMVLLHLDGAGPLGDPYQVDSANH